MKNYFYTNELSHQLLIALLKVHNIRKVVASPGATNISLVASMQQDPYFEIFSSVDERSAAYVACGMAAECGEPIVLSCTGATASRNYLPGLTEAYYRKLPILAITSNQGKYNIGHLIAQNLDRSRVPVDAALISVDIQNCQSQKDYWYCQLNISRAILELSHHGGGPVHINLATTYSKNYNIKKLPNVNVIKRYIPSDILPPIPKQRVAVFIGSHKNFNAEETSAIERFCISHNAVAFCDHTSGYKGKYRIMYALVAGQTHCPSTLLNVDLLIHIGEVSGDYYSLNIQPQKVWRVNPDGQLRDTFLKLTAVFEMSEIEFFKHYTAHDEDVDTSYYEECKKQYNEVFSKMPELNFSNVWIAKLLSKRIPQNSNLHLGILNTLRSWNFFDVDPSVKTYCNVGGFGIDGCVSTLIGASIINTTKIHFGIFGDLAFFYDLNSIGNRHINSNLRILLINNGCGTEFKNYSHTGAMFGDDVRQFIAAEGHFGNKSQDLVKHFSTDLGFEYFSASNKEEFMHHVDRFVTPENTDKPMLFEVFTNSIDESIALKTIRDILNDSKSLKEKMRIGISHTVSNMVGEEKKNAIKTLLSK